MSLSQVVPTLDHQRTSTSNQLPVFKRCGLPNKLQEKLKKKKKKEKPLKIKTD